MKVIVKNLKKVTYETAIESEEITIKNFKEEIERQHGFKSETLKLLKEGIILDDSKKLKDYDIKEESIITMMITKAKIKNEKSENINNDNKEEKKEEEKKIEMKKEIKDYSKEINQLIEMGFSKNEVEISIKAALGNIDKAIDYLYKGIKNIPINEENDKNEKKNNENDLNILDNKNEIEIAASVVKILVTSKKYTLNQVLGLIQRNDSDLFKRIKEQEKLFVELLKNPISEEDKNIYNAYAKKIGLENFQKKNNNKTNKIKLSKSEFEAVKRLKEFANVSDYQAYEAYIACDKNEELAVNFLLENYMGQNNNKNSHFVIEEKKDDDKKDNEKK